MTYSVDLRKKVVTFVERGGSQAAAARRFDISLWCVRYCWRVRIYSHNKRAYRAGASWTKRPCGRMCGIIRRR